jgi:hypothetical protein
MEKHIKRYRAHRVIAIFYAIVIVIFVAVIGGAILTGKPDGLPVVGMFMMFAFLGAIFCLGGISDRHPHRHLPAGERDPRVGPADGSGARDVLGGQLTKPCESPPARRSP